MVNMTNKEDLLASYQVYDDELGSCVVIPPCFRDEIVDEIRYLRQKLSGSEVELRDFKAENDRLTKALEEAMTVLKIIALCTRPDAPPHAGKLDTVQDYACIALERIDEIMEGADDV